MSFEVGNTYNFDTVAPAILGTAYTNMTLIGKVNFDIAITFRDVVTIHDAIVKAGISVLPAKNATYLLFKNQYNEKVVLAEDWIDPDTIVLVSAVKLNLIINDITTDDVAVILNMLRAMGYTNIESTVE